MAVTEQEQAKAFELFGQGMSTSAVANTLFKRDWARAKKLRVAWEEQTGGASAAPKPVKKKPGGKQGKTAPEPEESDEWDITLSTPTVRLIDIFAEFTSAEKATAIATILQQRLDAMLAPAA